MNAFSELLTRHVIQYQKTTGRLIKQKELARLLGIGETSLNLAWNGKRPPSRKIVEKCALFFDDLEFYDVAEIPRSDPRLSYINQNWDKVSEEGKKKICEEVEKYEAHKAEQGSRV